MGRRGTSVPTQPRENSLYETNAVTLERIIEKAGDVEASAAAVVSAVAVYAKMNANGQWLHRSELVNLNELFERMSREEMEAYARSICTLVARVELEEMMKVK